jgi:hypothetical protein
MTLGAWLMAKGGDGSAPYVKVLLAVSGVLIVAVAIVAARWTPPRHEALAAARFAESPGSILTRAEAGAAGRSASAGLRAPSGTAAARAAAGTGARAATAAGTAEAGALAQAGGAAIAVPAEFATVMQGDSDLAAFHAKLEAEARDDAWAGPIERLLRAHFDSTLDPTRYNVASVECRATACEILALGYGDDAQRGWMGSVTGLYDDESSFEALAGGPGNMACGGGDAAPGVMALHCVFTRTDPEDAGENTPSETFALDTAYREDVTAEPVAVPAAVLPAIESDIDMSALHRRLEAEATDFEWSGYVEALIAQYLAEIEPADSIAVHGVVCRTTLCEVQMSAPDERSIIEWLPNMLDFQRQDWHDLTTAGINDRRSPDSESVGFVWFLERAP